MKKKLLLSMICTLLLGSAAMFGVAYASGKITILVNGKAISSDAAPRMINNRVMVPISFISKALGANVGWDQKTQTVNVRNYGITPRDFFKETPEMDMFAMAEINNTIQVFMTGIDTGLESLISRAVTSDIDVNLFSQMQNFSMGQSFLSMDIADIRTIKGTSPREYQVIVAVKTYDVDSNLLEEFWDLTVVYNQLGGDKTSYLVKKYDGKIKKEIVNEHRMFPGYTFKLPF
ncbi:copper amine oxidase N-terminal domain-containing protein [Paenibacillaceae bacterium]|nr:copper amine oxidase N-terminal domain-containing protein [Paenibacillaceae bacterium]